MAQLGATGGQRPPSLLAFCWRDLRAVGSSWLVPVCRAQFCPPSTSRCHAPGPALPWGAGSVLASAQPHRDGSSASPELLMLFARPTNTTRKGFGRARGEQSEAGSSSWVRSPRPTCRGPRPVTSAWGRGVPSAQEEGGRSVWDRKSPSRKDLEAEVCFWENGELGAGVEEPKPWSFYHRS